VVADAPNDALVDLQVRYTHLEDLVQQLSEVVHTQQEQIEALRAAVKHMRGRLEALSAEPTPHERPPHN
jgi:SlyX protein